MKSRFILAAICTFFLATSISFGYRATFHPRLSVQGEYTDNVLLTENNDFKEDDVITTITPGFTADLVGKKAKATIIYDPSYAFYHEFDEFNGWRHQARLYGLYNFTKTTHLNIWDRFVYTEDPLRSDDLAKIRTEDPEIPIDSTVRKTRRVYYQNLASVNLNHQFGKYNSNYKIGYKYWFRDEDNEDTNVEDKESHTPSAGLTYWVSPHYGFDVNGSYRRGEFEVSDSVDIFSGNVGFLKRFGKHFIGYIRYSHTIVDYRGETQDDTTYNPSFGFKYDIEKDISLLADFGYFYNDYEFRESKSDFGGNLQLIKEFERGRLNVAALGGYDYSFFGAENLGFETFYEISASLNHRIAKHVSGNIFASYRDSEYTDSDRKDRIPIFGLGLSWQALEWMNIRVGYRFRSVDSTDETRDYEDNRVSLQITLKPEQPFHTSRY